MPKVKKYYHSHILYMNFLDVFVSLTCNTVQSGIIVPLFPQDVTKEKFQIHSPQTLEKDTHPALVFIYSFKVY